MSVLRPLPPNGGALVGRAGQLRRVGELLDAGAAAALSGPEGIGRTRLAVEVARQRQGERGAALCDLGGACDLASVVEAVVRDLGLAVRSTLAADELAGQVGVQLADHGPGAVILDDLAVAEGWSLAQQWARAAPSTAIVVTTELDVGLRLRGLQLPPPRPSPSRILGSEAVRWLRECLPARLAPELPAHALIAAEVVRLLRGAPRAIAWVAGAVGPGGLGEGLEQAVAVASAPEPDAVLSWLLDRLRPWERLALAELASFPAGFELHDAEAVVRLESGPDTPSVLDAVQALRRRGLVDDVGPLVAQGPPRFALPPRVRDAARRAADHGAHVRWTARVLDRARAWGEPRTHAERVERQRALQPDLAALDLPEAAALLHALRAPARAKVASFGWSEAGLQDRCGRAAERGDTVEQVACLGALAVTSHLAQRDEAADRYAAAIGLAGSTGDRAAEACWRACLGLLQAQSGSLDPALSVADALGVPAPIGAVIGLLAAGREALAAGERERALERWGEATDLAGSTADPVVAALLVHAVRAERERRLVWVIDPDGGWFLPPGGSRVELAHRPVLARILALLASGEARSLDEIVQAGWPEERIVARAAANRAYVALSTLRKLGLDVVERCPQGWRLGRPEVAPPGGPGRGSGGVAGAGAR